MPIRPITLVDETCSTNADLLACATTPEGAWLVARRQRQGRGRAGRLWADGAGNFMGSTLAVLRPGDPPASTLALAAGVATYDAVAAATGGLDGLVLKWPNDLLVGTAKLAGILLERDGDRVVVGVGVNLAQAPHIPGRLTTALAAHRPSPTLEQFAPLLAGSFARVLARWHGGEWPVLRAEWLARAAPPGTVMRLSDSADGTADEAGLATFVGLAADGAARLRLADGTVRVIHAGDIEMVGEYAAGD